MKITTKTCKKDGTSWTAPQSVWCPTCQDRTTDILGAVARGWCSKKNKKKVMDNDLANAIAMEIELLFLKRYEFLIKSL